MEDKGIPFDFKCVKLGIVGEEGFRELPMVADSLKHMNLRKKSELGSSIHEIIAPMSKSYSFSFDGSSMDKAAIDKLLGIDMQSQIGRVLKSSVTIQGEPYIIRPKNLKYPNKKRARRIWKKWSKRFGTTPAKYVFIPRAVISFKPEFKNNQLHNTVEILAEKVTE